MSSSAVGTEASVTLTLADTQGLLSGGLDTVTLNIASQVGATPRRQGPPSRRLLSEGIYAKRSWWFCDQKVIS